MVDYSKWNDIEISDDEDETHPNIDTPSLFRWRHQARVERMAELEQTKTQHGSRKTDYDNRLKEVKDKLSKASQDEEVAKLQATLKQLEVEGKKLKEEEEELKSKEKKMPLNVDTISKPGFAKTVINNPPPRVATELTEEEKEKKLKTFVKENESLLKQYGMFRRYDDSKQFLLKHNQLTCEETANYLVIWCINLEVEGKHELMGHVAHQCICMQYILELAKQLDMDPRGCVGSFFSRIVMAEVEYKRQFDLEVEAFKERISKRANEKIQEAVAEQEEEDRLGRLGPGGLDPVEVMESLPEALQKCFESRDIKMLQEAIAAMPEEEAKYHIKRCVDSGMWLPDGGKKEEEGAAEQETPSES